MIGEKVSTGCGNSRFFEFQQFYVFRRRLKIQK
nr:MAG TPA: hypothetical protein [Inoviridae sp.]